MMRVSSKIRLPLQAGHTRIAFSSSSITLAPPLSFATGAPSQRLAEPLQRQLQPLVRVHARLPTQQRARARDVGLADLGIVHGQRPEDDLAARAGEPKNTLGQLEQRPLWRVAPIPG